MIFNRVYVALVMAAVTVVTAAAQDAQEIINVTAKIYDETKAYSTRVNSRTLQFVFVPTPPGAEPRFQVVGSLYRQVDIKFRRANNYWLEVQTLREGPGGGQGSGPTSWMVLARNETTAPKRAQSASGRVVTQTISPEAFGTLLSESSVYRDEADLVLRHFQGRSSLSEGNLPLGLIEPELIGKETVDGQSAFRIAAKTFGDSSVVLWIDAQSYLILRSIIQLPATGGLGRQVSVIETFYTGQQLNPVLGAADFAIKDSLTPGKLTADLTGFSSAAEVVKRGQIKPATPGPDTDGKKSPAANEPAVPMPAVAAAPVNTGQALSYEQMSGIVLIEGDGGTATGFMTKIRDVDFVVTNLHVLGSNKKIALKTLAGAEIPYFTIFGAAGSDIAIIRIGTGHGNLRLAEDVFKSSKIGDNVVVVGNRQGGGVATQIAGSIVGIGPTRVEVDASFEPGNSGSPIMNLATGEVVGVASYSETRRIQVDDESTARSERDRSGTAQVEKRWFGYRLDSVVKWEAIDLAKWHGQGERIDNFRELSEALVAVLKFDFDTARRHPKLNPLIVQYEARARTAGNGNVNKATAVKDLFRVIRSISEDGLRDLSTGDYYDYYRTCLYWESSIPAQIEYRKAIVEVLKKYEANSAGYLSRMRGGI